MAFFRNLNTLSNKYNIEITGDYEGLRELNEKLDGEDIMDKLTEKDITLDNLVYPNDFYDFSKGLPIPDYEIKNMIKNCIKSIREDNMDYCYITTGNTMVAVAKTDDTYEIMVTNNYKSICVEK